MEKIKNKSEIGDVMGNNSIEDNVNKKDGESMDGHLEECDENELKHFNELKIKMTNIIIVVENQAVELLNNCINTKSKISSTKTIEELESVIDECSDSFEHYSNLEIFFDD